jgi:O-glycosyl hydrolase
MKRNATRTLRIIILLVLPHFLSGWKQSLLAEQPATSTFRVHPETTYQTITGFGTGFNQSSLQHLNAIRKPEDRARAYDLLYGNDGLHLNIVRLTVSPTVPALAVVPLDLAPGAGSLRLARSLGTRCGWQAVSS